MRYHIPKIHHALWFTENPIPDNFREYRASWVRHNPDWDFRLWTLSTVYNANIAIAEKFKNMLPPICIEMLLNDDLHWVLKTDIARWLVLWLYGGIYSDTDVECRKPMSALLDNSSFAALSCTPGIVGNAVAGAIQGYELMLKIAIATAEKIAGHIPAANKNIVDYGVNIAGSMLKGCGLILPAHYFYPFGSGSRKRDATQYPDSYCIHHWSGMDKDGWYEQTIGKDKEHAAEEGATTAIFFGPNHKDFHKNKETLRRAIGAAAQPEQPKVNIPPPATINKPQIVPKIIHRIWFGPKQMPEKFVDFLAGQVKQCPGYDTRLWDEDSARQYHPFMLSSSVEMLEDTRLNPVIKSDVLRYELLRLFGGTYIDTDVEVLRNFDELLGETFFCADEGMDNIGSALLGSVPFHPLNYAMLIAMYETYGVRGVPESPNQQMALCGPWLLTQTAKRFKVTVLERRLLFPFHKPRLPATVHYFAGGQGWTKKL